MKIAIDVRDTIGEKSGKGWYTYCLVKALLELDKANEYILYSHKTNDHFTEFKQARPKVIQAKGIKWHILTLFDLLREKVDIFIAPTSYIIPAFAPKRLKTCVVLHDLVALLFAKNHNKKAVLIEKFTLKKALQKAQHVVCVSENTKKDVLKFFPIEKEKTQVVYPSVDDSFRPLDINLYEWRKERQLPKNFFLCVGTLEPRKNLTAVLEALSGMIDNTKKREENPHLVVIGGRGWQFKKIFSKLNDLNIAEYVVFKGYVTNQELIKYYNTALGLVFPSFYEGFGLPPLEAMKSGCPVITSNAGSLPEVVGEAALQIDPNSIQDLAKAMKKLYDNEELRLELAVKGLKRSELFNWHKSAQAILKLISHE